MKKQINIEKEIKAAAAALENIAQDHQLAPDSYKEELREDAREMSCGGMFAVSPRKAGQSYNAMYAEQRGELTKSKLPAVLRRMLDAGFAKTSMWHHTGMFKGFMNETEFYAACDFDLAGYENYLNNKEAVDQQRAAEAEAEMQRKVAAIKIQNEAKKKRADWLAVNTTTITRTTDRAQLFVVTAQEMNGKYGWFDSSKKSYNMTEYFSGHKLIDGVNPEEYHNIK